MNFNRPPLLFVLALLLAALSTQSATVYYAPANNVYPPAMPREFRGAWVATVANIDWPSQPGLSVAQQKMELLAILNRAVNLKLNAIVFQVRPMADAFYQSRLEPWSYYLNGVMGKAPEPIYDPLAFAVEEAHRRGLELHAWFNPFRAGSPKEKFPLAPGHISRTHPNWVQAYGKQIWLDPGLKEVQEYSLRVILDVVQRYDIDGVHFDDYFYPYREQDAHKREIPFPDDASWKKSGMQGKMSRDDWRRENVNTFVHRAYEAVKSAKPWVKFGIAPFGIWQPGNPAQIKGFNAYDVLYCDSRKWLTNGWLDYCAPQLYWSIAAPDQSFPVLLKWWQEQNTRHRNIYPGIDMGRVGGKWKADEIINQIKLTRAQMGESGGDIGWSMKSLMGDHGGLATALEHGLYAEPALIPSYPWLETKPPAKPGVTLDGHGQLKWKPAGFEKIAGWVLQTKTGNQWQNHILPGETRQEAIAGTPEIIALTAIDRYGLASEPFVLAQQSAAGK